MKMTTYITRWLDRPPHTYYLRTLKQSWKVTGTELIVAMSGPLCLEDTSASDLIRLNRHIVMDAGDLPLPKRILKCIDDGLEDGNDIIGFMDDDAQFVDPILFIERIKYAVSEGYGAVGPMNPFRHWLQYASKGVKTELVYDMTRSPWCSLGSQFYSAEMLRATEHLWRPFLSESNWRSDFPLFMFASFSGYRTGEFFVQGYNHSTSQASSYTESLEDHYNRRCRTIQSDYEIILRHLEGLGDPRYCKDALKIRRYEYMNLRNRVRKAGAEFITHHNFDDYLRSVA